MIIIILLGLLLCYSVKFIYLLWNINEMDKVIGMLHPLEKRVLSVLFDGISLKGISTQTDLQKVEIVRALQWLENKGLIKVKKETKEYATFDKNWEEYEEKGLPERRFIQFLDSPKTLEEIRKKSGMSSEEVNACIGILKKEKIIELKDKISITDSGKKFVSIDLPQEELMKKLPISPKRMSKDEKKLFSNLLKRKELVKYIIVKEMIVHLSSRAKSIIKDINSGKVPDLLGTLTPEVIKSGKWKSKGFREYDIKINVPKINAGKRHPYSKFLWDVKSKLCSMGFKEMNGPIIESEFFNFDVLFQPQNHPARDWSDTYKIKEPKKGKLPNKKIVEAIKLAHEKGGKTSSKGWIYSWSEEIAKCLMPRAQGTALSARALVEGAKSPGKYFGIARCYRPDVIDATHGVEFNQLEGFVIGDNITFRQLLGLLKQFACEITGAKEVRFKPDYYPFTEPSVEMAIKHPKFGWLELGGAGVFRPEITETLGYKQRVIAWGLGVDRLAMLKLGIKDLRDLFTRDIEKLRRCQQ